MKLRGDLFGSFQGKIGKAYGRMVHGVNLGAVMPVKRGSDKSTAAQLDQQIRFGLLGSMASAFLNAIRIGLKTAAKNMGPLVSPFDAFVKINAENVHCEGGASEIEYGSLVLAKGHLPEVAFAAASFAEPQRVSVSWTPNSDIEGADADDDVYVVVYEPVSNIAVLSAPVKRSVSSIDVRVPALWSGLEVHVYGFSIGGGRGNTGVTGNSAYIGTGSIG